jgi:hypothetical protein
MEIHKNKYKNKIQNMTVYNCSHLFNEIQGEIIPFSFHGSNTVLFTSFAVIELYLPKNASTSINRKYIGN